MLSTTSIREALLGEAGGTTGDGELGQVLADLGLAQCRLRALDDDYYVHGALAQSRYRSVKAKLEREIDRLHQLIEAATKQRFVLHPDPRADWAEADIAQRRELVRLIVERETILPARRAVPRFDAIRFRVELTRCIRIGMLILSDRAGPPPKSLLTRAPSKSANDANVAFLGATEPVPAGPVRAASRQTTSKLSISARAPALTDSPTITTAELWFGRPCVVDARYVTVPNSTRSAG